MAPRQVHQVLKELREEVGITASELARRLGISQSVISRRESGQQRWTPFEIKRAADVLDTSLEAISRRMSAAAQPADSVGIPVINRAPAGHAIDYEEYGVLAGQRFEYLDREAATLCQGLLAVVVVGRSMSPLLEEGDTIILRPVPMEDPESVVSPGKIVFVRLGTSEYADEGCMLAQWWPVKEQPSMVRLHKVNPEYPGRIVPKSHVTWLWLAIQKRSKI